MTASRQFPSWKQWKRLPRILSISEKKILQAALSLAVISFVTLGAWYVASHRIEIPAVGGEYTEGLIGSPQFVNPLYASVSDVDADLTQLIYSGLFRWNQNEGLVPDLAETYEISEDQKTYTIKIRENARWHNGDPVRSSDVLFTIQSIQNPAFHSPLAVSFRGVTASEVDELTVQFVLEEPFAPFLSSLTVGILPSSLWAEIPAKNTPLTSLNLAPIGSGPYKFDKYTVEKKGDIKSYSLVRNPDYYGEPPKIERLVFKFYHDTQTAVAALQNQNIEGLSFVPSHLLTEVEKIRSVKILHPDMPQAVTLFFNEEKQPLFEDEDVRKALALTINKEEIINTVLNGNATIIDSPILPGEIGFNAEAEKITQNIEAAKELISQTDYKDFSPDGFAAIKSQTTEADETSETFEELTLTLTTINQPTFIKTAETIAAQAKLAGIKILIETTEPSLLYEEIIKPRAYQMILTATQYDIDADPYPFWHSSQAKDPGLNLSLYSSHKVDDLLEKARSTNNLEERAAAYQEFQDLIVKDLPAIFLYQPAYTYAVSSKIKNINLEKIQSPTDRFQDIENWYIKTRQVLK
ncbi:MAG: Extracellular solute-binding protein [Candidatus Uhrbacteria bacterium GW2011_GWE2_45_35]|uniref:Extracellular solute-binding protein n=2 Tax=Candidatus Uhriibacteriota TaxID=1752732 RepID=A0A0G1JDU2_9BACT|nr:MAG: Extracellular solute-binding protein [Candidatus Uhrbacteria bacterium GW2011_GWF2_44_350]KKU06345.1 MAG: Extracellular solute-binding protein [Candidatus Uhrbacteria bacterium GW2011_GWE2_45_35]